MEKVLIAGISGGQGRLLARRLLDKFQVCGVDRVAWRGHPREVHVHTVDLRKKKFEDVLRIEQPTAVVHMGFIRHFRAAAGLRHDVNVRGTKQLLDHCVRHEVEALVEVDTLASAFLWRYPQIRTCVLRPVNVLGYYQHSMIGQYLRKSPVPTVMGFDPMMQFIHEEDLSEAVALALERGLRGVFNVTGPGEVPLHTAIRETGGAPLPLPEPVMRTAFNQLFRWGLTPFPPGAIDYLKFPLTISGDAFRDAADFKPHFGLQEIFQSLRR
jgi:UDP-glucose 4-epimerase